MADRLAESDPALNGPTTPKRGLSAYMFFANEHGENVKTENPGISSGMPDCHSGWLLAWCYC